MVGFSAGSLGGWIRQGSDDRRVLLLHGGPGLTDYMGWLADDLDGWTCASFQQRGHAPSTLDGPFDVATAVADVATVLDHLSSLGWTRPLVAGHSWGGHLAWHVAAALGDRVGGVLAIDPLGAVGDMGLPAFGAELRRRARPQDAERLDELEALEDAGQASSADHLEALRRLWPGYFADPAAAPPMPAGLDVNPAANEELFASLTHERPALEAALGTVVVSVGAVAGQRSPMATAAASDTTALIPGAWTEVVPDAGHFPWHEAPGVVSAALARLL